MSSRSANDRYRPDSGVSWIDGMPPRSRNQRTPTGPDTPHAIAASSLKSPSAIFIQNPRSTSRRTGGRPGDRIAGRPVSVTIHPRGRPIQHLHLEMLRRPVEFTVWRKAMHDGLRQLTPSRCDRRREFHVLVDQNQRERRRIGTLAFEAAARAEVLDEAIVCALEHQFFPEVAPRASLLRVG